MTRWKTLGVALAATGVLLAPLTPARSEGLPAVLCLFSSSLQPSVNSGVEVGPDTTVGAVLGAVPESPIDAVPGAPSAAATVDSAPTYGGVSWLPTHTVVSGDTLWKIAQKYCGDGNQWRNIFQANRYQIRDPHWIYPGQRFQIACTAGQSYTTESGKPWYETEEGKQVVEESGGHGSEFITHMPLPRGSFRISSDFGPRSRPRTANGGRGSADHKGIDLAAPQGTPVGAVGPGIVLRSGWNGGYGQFIEIQHPDGMITRYGHLKSGSLLVKKGDRIAAGEQIAQVGTTGNSSGPHLHFEVRRPDMVAVNPAPVIGLA